ncbi:ROK family transcriptional regulator [Brachybacterium hainanense]|uniref:ROK family protein n=1 Tax=Brachybacterium hainanense TaxID=1541174 RepID=A0ABV6R7H3_9MICO
MTGVDSSPASIRHATTRSCYLALRDSATPLSVAELVAATGLSRPTVDSVLTDLQATGLVVPAAPGGEGAPGRPARRVVVDPAAAQVAALDIGARTIRCVLTDAAGAVQARSAVPVDLADIGACMLRAIAETGGEPRAVGVAAPGLLAADGTIAQSLALPELVGRDLAGDLERALGCPVTLENDIKLAAYAEHHLGPDADSLVLVQIGHRISVGLVVGGQILQGAHRLAGELGTQRGMRWTRSSQRGRLVWSTGDEARPLLESAATGESEAVAEIARFCDEIAPRLAGLLLAVDPELLVIGGGLSRAGETLLHPLRAAIEHQLMAPGRPRVLAAALPTDGSLIGALGRAFEHGSPALLGVPGIPPPWHRLREAL